jgi:hypothetical protein
MSCCKGLTYSGSIGTGKYQLPVEISAEIQKAGVEIIGTGKRYNSNHIRLFQAILFDHALLCDCKIDRVFLMSLYPVDITAF